MKFKWLLPIFMMLSLNKLNASSPPIVPYTSEATAPDDLSSHSLAYAPGPLDNPLKGFMPYSLKDSADDRLYPFSMEFGYFSLKELMLDWNRYDWSPLEKFLTMVSNAGNQAVVRIYIEYPGLPSGIPDFLRKSGIAIRKTKSWNTDSPDYDDPRTLQAISHFIKAWAKEYDGDPRIGFIQLGLIGLWGEWHLYPSTELFPNDASTRQVVDAFADSFKKTRLLVRYGHSAGGEAVPRHIGFHDDSFGFKESDSGEKKSVTLPESLGGWDWSFLQDLLDHHAENQWVDAPMGGELRPEIQTLAFSDNPEVDDLSQDVALGHISWLLDEKGIEAFKAGTPGMDALTRSMGYDLWVKKAFFAPQQKPGSLRIGILVTNQGVARFYYPWKVLLALRDAQGHLAAEWSPPWDLSQVQPEKIQAFPDWKLGRSLLPFGKPRYYGFEVGHIKIPRARYSVLLQLQNPLPSSRAKKFRFSNQSQENDGWLNLGTLNAGE